MGSPNIKLILKSLFRTDKMWSLYRGGLREGLRGVVTSAGFTVLPNG